MNVLKRFFIVVFIAFISSSCSSEREDAAEDVAIAFFDAIYNKKDIEVAAALCAPNLATQIHKYMTAKNVARRLFNMSFDSVKIDAALGDIKIREEFKNSGKLTLLFTGNRHGKIYKDLKRVKLIKLNNKWFVELLLKDPVSN